MGMTPKQVRRADDEGKILVLQPVDGKITVGINGSAANYMQAFGGISPVELIGMIQEAAGLESSDPDSWTYRTQAFEWALEKTGGDADAALRVARFIADGDEAVR